MDTFAFDLVTPQAAFFSGPARLVEAPGTLGDFGVLKGHMPFITTLKPGVVRVHREAETLRIFVAGGIAEVNPDSCTILAERAEDLSALTPGEAQARLVQARATLDACFEEAARLEAAHELEVAEAIAAALAQ